MLLRTTIFLFPALALVTGCSATSDEVQPTALEASEQNAALVDPFDPGTCQGNEITRDEIRALGGVRSGPAFVAYQLRACNTAWDCGPWTTTPRVLLGGMWGDGPSRADLQVMLPTRLQGHARVVPTTSATTGSTGLTFYVGAAGAFDASSETTPGFSTMIDAFYDRWGRRVSLEGGAPGLSQLGTTAGVAAPRSGTMLGFLAPGTSGPVEARFDASAPLMDTMTTHCARFVREGYARLSGGRHVPTARFAVLVRF